MFYRGTWHRDMLDVVRSMGRDGVTAAEVSLLDGTLLTVDLDDPLVGWMLV